MFVDAVQIQCTVHIGLEFGLHSVEKCFEFWFVLPNGIKTLRLTVKMGIRPTQRLNLFHLHL